MLNTQDMPSNVLLQFNHGQKTRLVLIEDRAKAMLDALVCSEQARHLAATLAADMAIAVRFETFDEAPPVVTSALLTLGVLLAGEVSHVSQ